MHSSQFHEGDHVRVLDGVSLRGYHGDCRTGSVRGEADRQRGTGVVLVMDEPNSAGARIAGPFYTGEIARA